MWGNLKICGFEYSNRLDSRRFHQSALNRWNVAFIGGMHFNLEKAVGLARNCAPQNQVSGWLRVPCARVARDGCLKCP